MAGPWWIVGKVAGKVGHDSGKYRILVKVIDIFGNEQAFDVEVK